MKIVSPATSTALPPILNKESLVTKFSRIHFFVISLLALVAGIVLIALALVTLPLVPALIPGIVLVALASVFLIYKFYSTKCMSVISDEAFILLEVWFAEQQHKDMQVNHGAHVKDFKGRSARQYSRLVIKQAKNPELKQIYKEKKYVLLFMYWQLKAIDGINQDSETAIRKIVSCYKLIRACAGNFNEIIRPVFSDLQASHYQEKARAIPPEDHALFCLTYCWYNAPYLTPLRAGPRCILNRYLDLRRQNDARNFFTPGHPFYYARLAFNESVRLYRGLFNINKLQKMYNQKDYSYRQERNLYAILSFIKTTDDGSDFLTQHKNTKRISRLGADGFLL
ncbi:hypothetical protein C10C_0418 [Chlamydia serpentis]|uniref:Uncharacterized protein n=1 Tax=Chlamydia serpentis TaxID=1967782 RepID=A0A2R8FAY2_9CHLA|nr:hypothetical protein [Chlamydia serpentis]SPN73585.1 hypothetical protein C10C_0418 [Chlamydia serpentis]